MTALAGLLDALLAARLAPRLDVLGIKAEAVIGAPGPAVPVGKVDNDVRLPSNAALDRQLPGAMAGGTAHAGAVRRRRWPCGCRWRRASSARCWPTCRRSLGRCAARRRCCRRAGSLRALRRWPARWRRRCRTAASSMNRTWRSSRPAAARSRRWRRSRRRAGRRRWLRGPMWRHRLQPWLRLRRRLPPRPPWGCPVCRRRSWCKPWWYRYHRAMHSALLRMRPCRRRPLPMRSHRKPLVPHKTPHRFPGKPYRTMPRACRRPIANPRARRSAACSIRCPRIVPAIPHARPTALLPYRHRAAPK